MGQNMSKDAPQEGAENTAATAVFSLVAVPMLGDLDGRTRAARLFRGTLAALLEDRGGADMMSNGELLVARRAAGVSVLCEAIEAKIVAGETLTHDLVNGYLAATNAFRRLTNTLGLRRSQRDITPRRLSAIIQGQAR